MPKGVLWRQHDIFLSSMGGRPWGSDQPLASHDELAEKARASAGAMSMMMIPPFMHGAAQWAAFNAVTMGGRLVIPDDVERMRPAEVLRLAAEEKVLSMPVVGDAIARPLLDEIETGDYDLSGLFTITNGGAPLSPTVRERILDRAAAPDAARRGRRLGVRRADEHGDDGGRRGRRPPRSPRSPTPRSSRRTSTGCCSPARARAGWPVAI